MAVRHPCGDANTDRPLTKGAFTGELVRRVGVSKPTVIAWKRRYVAERQAHDSVRHGSFTSADELITAIRRFIDGWMTAVNPSSFTRH